MPQPPNDNSGTKQIKKFGDLCDLVGLNFNNFFRFSLWDLNIFLIFYKKFGDLCDLVGLNFNIFFRFSLWDFNFFLISKK